MRVTGTHVGYYFVCRRKLWFFSHGIECEHESDLVRMGRHVHESSYEREKKDLEIDQTIVLDWFDRKRGVVHEVKKSRALEASHEWQVYYYLWYLKRRGVPVASVSGASGVHAELDYPLLKKRRDLWLGSEAETRLEAEVLPGVEEIMRARNAPSYVKISACDKCAYLDLCRV